MLTTALWLTDGSYRWSALDHIYSYLIDHPEKIYLTPNKQQAYVLVIGHGLVRILHDYRGMTPLQITGFVYSVLKRRHR